VCLLLIEKLIDNRMGQLISKKMVIFFVSKEKRFIGLAKVIQKTKLEVTIKLTGQNDSWVMKTFFCYKNCAQV